MPCRIVFIMSVFATILAVPASAIAAAPTTVSTPTATVFGTSVRIAWTSDEPGTSDVYWDTTPHDPGVVGDYADNLTTGWNAGETHSRWLSGLAPGTYYTRVRSEEFGTGNGASSAQISFVIDDAPENALALPSVDGSVNTIVPTADKTIVGGSFDFAGVETGHGALTSGATHAVRPTAKVSSPFMNTVSAVRSDGAGGFYIGGSIRSAGGLATASTFAGVVHILPDGGVDTAFTAPAITGEISDLELFGGLLYVSGSFTTVGGNARNRIAALNPTTGALDATFAPPTGWSAGFHVKEIEGGAAGVLYAAGDFTNVGGDGAQDYLMKLNATTGVIDAAFTPQPSHRLYDVLYDGTNVVAGGEFSTIGGGASTYVARLHPDTGTLVTAAAAAVSVVGTLASDGTSLYIGTRSPGAGTVRKVGLTTLAADPTFTTTLASPTGGGTLNVFDIAVDGTSVYVAGLFNISGQQFGAVLNKTTGAATTVDASFDDVVYAVDVSDGRAYWMGAFRMADAVMRGNIAAFDPSTGALTNVNPSPGPVNAMVVSATHLYVASGASVTRYSLDTGSQDLSFLVSVSHSDSGAQFFSPHVRALDLAADTLYIGGMFNYIDVGLPEGSRGYGAAVTVNGTPTLTAFDPGITDDYVPAPEFKVDFIRAVGASRVLISGETFDNVNGGASAARSAWLNPTTGTALAFTPAINGGAVLGADPDPFAARTWLAGAFTSLSGYEKAGSIDTSSYVVDSGYADPNLAGTAAWAAHRRGRLVFIGGDTPDGSNELIGIPYTGGASVFTPDLGSARVTELATSAGGLLYAAGPSLDFQSTSASFRGLAVFRDWDAPTTPSAINDGAGADTDDWVTGTTWTANWPAAADATFGVHRYDLCISANSAGADCAGGAVGPWADAGAGALTAIRGGLTFVDGVEYFACVRAVDASENVSGVVCSDGAVVEAFPPVGPANVIDGASGADSDLQRDSTSFAFSWPAATDPTGIQRYDTCITTSSTGADCAAGGTPAPWQAAGTALSTTRAGLALGDGVKYYACVRAVDNANAVAGAVCSDGMVVDFQGPVISVPATFGRYVNSKSTTLLVTALDYHAGVTSLTATYKGASVAVVNSRINLAALPVGPGTLAITSTDGLGNPTTLSRAIVVDRAAPRLTPARVVTTTPAVTIKIIEAGSGIARVRRLKPAPIRKLRVVKRSIVLPAPRGTTTYVIETSDAAGNIAKLRVVVVRK